MLPQWKRLLTTKYISSYW